MLEGTTYYSEDGKKSVTITGKAPMRRDRYHADYYPVTIVDAKGNEDTDYLSDGVIRNRFPRTAPKPETGKTITTAKQMAMAIKKETGITVATGKGDAYYRAFTRGNAFIGKSYDTDEFEVFNLPEWAEEMLLLEGGFECRKIATPSGVAEVWSK